MSEWYFIENGEQQGPVAEAELIQRLQSGSLNAQSTMVWQKGMSDWMKVSEVASLSNALGSPAASQTPDFSEPLQDSPAKSTDGSNPYAAPTTADPLAEPTPDEELEIPSQPVPLAFGFNFDVAFGYIKTHMGVLVGATAVFIGISWAVSALGGFVQIAIDGANTTQPQIDPDADFASAFAAAMAASNQSFGPGYALAQLIQNIGNLFLTLGVTRLYLNILRGRRFDITDLFSQGGALLSAFIAQLIYFLLVGLGLVLLIVPGLWVLSRLFFYQYAIVEKGLGPIEALKYSFELTRDNALPVFGILLVSGILGAAGAIACCVGVLWTIPIAGLVVTSAFLYLHGGPQKVVPPQDKGSQLQRQMQQNYNP